MSPVVAEESPTIVDAPIEDTRPIIWQGNVPGATPESTVVVHAESLATDPTGYSQIELVQLGSAQADEQGLFTVRANPEEWYGRLADAEGRVGLMVTASANNGERIGLSILIVKFDQAVARSSESTDQGWVLDDAMINSGALSEPDDSGNIDIASARRSATVSPSTQITMSDTPADMVAGLRSAAQARETTRSVQRDPFPGGWVCTWGQGQGFETTWATMGNYYLEQFGPQENFGYESTHSTTSEWGYNVGATVGAFNAGGKVSFAEQSSFGRFARHTQAQTGNKLRSASIINIKYKRELYTGCAYGGTGLPTMVRVLKPQGWEGDAQHFSVGITATPYANNSYIRPLSPGSEIGRSHNMSSGVTDALSVGWGNGSLSGGVSYSTNHTVGNRVTRSWTNPTTSTVKKHIKGYGNEPQESGVVGVRGYT